MEMVCVFIPIHKAKPSDFELISFQQCFRVFRKYPIKIVTSPDVSLDEYLRVVPKFDIVTIDPKWQSSLLNYNKLKLSQFFYNLFKDYQFLLTYELDAFAFRDDLLYWCNKNFDYIGAPWFKGFGNGHSGEIIGVGNSGFSLRKIESTKFAIKNLYYKDPTRYEGGPIESLKTFFWSPYARIRNLAEENFSIQKAYFIHEDLVLSNFFAVSKRFNIAPVDEALRFSFEVNPEILYQKNSWQLPMGCHGWWKYDLEFWKPFIEAEGYSLQTIS
jgi:hypothetical protein